MSWLSRLFRPAAPAPGESVEARLSAARAAAESGDYQTALGLWRELAPNTPRAASNIGACFAEGLGVERAPDLAFRWLSIGAEAGDPVGQRNLATLYFRGEGVAQSDEKAQELYRRASEQGDAPAQDMLSWMLLEGERPEHFVEAKRWAEAAAAQGVAASMTRLGMIHHNALGVARDPAAAADWWRRAAELGDADGQAMLGAALLMGAGVARDDEAARVWLLRAREGGSPLAARYLTAATPGAAP